MLKEPERTAAEVLERTKWDGTVPIFARHIAERCDVKIIQRNGCADAQACNDGKGELIIAINPSCDEAHLNFSVARELGRYILPIYKHIAKNDLVGLQKELGLFAGALLIPEEVLREKVIRHPPEELSRIFLCPEDVIEARMRRIMDPFEAVHRFLARGAPLEIRKMRAMRAMRRLSNLRRRQRTYDRKDVVLSRQVFFEFVNF